MVLGDQSYVITQEAYNSIMGIFGQFTHKELEIDGFEHLVISKHSMSKLAHYNTQIF
jgi:hypothetical protein